MSVFMKWTLSVLIILLPAIMLFAGETESLFQEGNRLYQEGKYSEALDIYQKIYTAGFASGDLFFNIGNCYYKLEDIGRAVLYYERARNIIPGDEALKFNLDLAGLKVVDKITPQEEFILIRLFRSLTHFIPKAWHLRAVFGLYIASIAALIIWIVSRKRSVRVTTFRIGVFLGLLFLIILMLLVTRLRQDRLDVKAVILTEKADVMSAPGGEGVDVFSLHAGTVVRIDNRTGDWLEIVLADGKVGWIRTEVLEEI